jgi:hypothetical protein
LGERLNGIQEVARSIRVSSTNLDSNLVVVLDAPGDSGNDPDDQRIDAQRLIASG